MWIILIAVVVLLFLFGGSSATASSSNQAYAPSREKPPGVPETVWDDREHAFQIAEEVDLPFDPLLELAIWWRESLGEEQTPNTPEYGVGQVTEIATRDVNEAFGTNFDYPPDSPYQAKKISAYYDKLNWQRAARETHSEVAQRAWMIRAHNEGPDPHLQVTIPYMNDVLDFYEQLKG